MLQLWLYLTSHYDQRQFDLIHFDCIIVILFSICDAGLKYYIGHWDTASDEFNRQNMPIISIAVLME